tara:strand:+ start:923 stop:1426 length:504 start_codon:yes stop_codon:yes gene_type:complete
MRIFKEEQRFTQLWLIVIMSMSSIVFLGIILKEYFAENSTMKTLEMTLIIGFYFACIIPIFFFKLSTRIDEKGIHYKFSPFHRSFKIKLWSEITSVSVRKYDAISEYGGWGYKGFFGKKGNAINISGNIGIQLEFINGKKLLIGTKKELDAKSVLETYHHKISTHGN